MSRAVGNPPAVALSSLLLLVACGERGTSRAVEHWTLSETLRIGTMEEGPASFGHIGSIAVDDRAQVWVLDQQAMEIRVFSPEGAHVRNVGRAGAGPGEFVAAEGISIAPDGRLWVRDFSAGRFSVFNADGSLDRTWSPGFCTRVRLWEPRMEPDRIVEVGCMDDWDRAVGRWLVAYHTDMSAVDTIRSVPDCETFAVREAGRYERRAAGGISVRGVPWGPRALEAVGDGGSVWCAPSSARAELLRFGPDPGDTLRVTVEVTPREVSTVERDSAIAVEESRGPSGLDESRIPRTKPLLDRLTVDDVGRLWVRHTLADGTVAFHVVGPDGRPIAEARIEGHRPEVTAPFVVRQDAVYAVTLDHEGVPSVSRFDIRRP